MARVSVGGLCWWLCVGACGLYYIYRNRLNSTGRMEHFSYNRNRDIVFKYLLRGPFYTLSSCIFSDASKGSHWHCGLFDCVATCDPTQSCVIAILLRWWYWWYDMLVDRSVVWLKIRCATPIGHKQAVRQAGSFTGEAVFSLITSDTCAKIYTVIIVNRTMAVLPWELLVFVR